MLCWRVFNKGEYPMWFKNLRVYRLTKSFEWDDALLEAKLTEHSFKPCQGQEQSKYGWVPPLANVAGDKPIDELQMAHRNQSYLMLCAKKQERVLPAAVVNEILDERVKEIEDRESRKVTRKEKTDLKDEVRFDLLPRAFTKSSLQYGYIDPRQGLVVINAASATRADEFLVALREALESLPVIPLAAKNSPNTSMTHWLSSQDLPANFQLGHECELKDSQDEQSHIRGKYQDLTSVDILNHIESGMYVSKLGLDWNDALSFVLDDQMAIKRLQFSDELIEQHGNLDADTAIEQFDNDFALMTLELSKLLQELIAALGGIDETITSADEKMQLLEKESPV